MVRTGGDAELDALIAGLDIASLVTLARESTRLRQFDFAQESGIGQALLSRYESGKRVPTIRSLARVAARAGVVLTVSMEIGGREQNAVFDGRAYLIERRARVRIARLQREIDKVRRELERELEPGLEQGAG